jgi:16S rRNA (guanine527-N7)-methyltransferase
MTMIDRLVHDASSLGVALTAHDAERLLQLLAELERWNRTYNLTAITGQEAMITHHLLDSLAVHRYLYGVSVADAGTGAGFPGLPLALVNPERRFTLIDSNGKKTRFVAHAAHLIGLVNVEAVHERVESLEASVPFDTVVARAFAPLPELLARVSRLVGPSTRVLAMQGKWPVAGLETMPPRWEILESHELAVPGLTAERTLIILRRVS